jgi:hypothetical protein
MNYWLDRGFFLLLMYAMIYASQLGAAPQWIGLFGGAFAIIAIGAGIEIYKKVKSNG